MNVIPVKTRIMQPPKDDLFEVMDTYLPKLREKDVLVVTSKVVAIHEGRCVEIVPGVEKEELVKKEADYYWKTPEGVKWRLTVKYNTFVSASGIDESNGDGYYILLPEDPFESAREIWKFTRKKFGLKHLGVIITDSYSLAFRYGAMSISIGYYGIKPLRHYEGKKDLFGRKFHYERNNMVDAVSAASTLVMGEGKECIPLSVVRDVPGLQFTNRDTRKELLIPHKEDIYYPLLRRLYEEEEGRDGFIVT